MAEQRVGILVQVVDKSTSVLKGIGLAGKSALGVLRDAGEKTKKGFEVLNNVIGFFFRATELAKTGIDMFKTVIVENVIAMMEYRGEHDKITKRFKMLGEEARYTKAVFVDLLTPAILGFQDAFNKVGPLLINYINANRRLIATNIIEFLAETGRVLTSVVGEALIWVSRTISGVIEAWNVLGMIVNKSIAYQLTSIGTLLKGVSALSEAFTLGYGNTVSKAIDKVSNAAISLGNEFDDGVERNIQSIENQVAKQNSLENSIRSVQATVTNFINNEAEPAMLRWANSWDGVKKRSKLAIEEMMKALQRLEKQATLQISIDQGLTDIRIANLTRIEEAQMKHYQRQREGAQAVAGAIGQIGSAWTNVALAAIASSADIGKAVVSALIDSVIISINAVAAMAAARAFAANQDFPIVGIAIGLAAASAAAAIAKGFISNVPAKAQRGYRTPAGGSTEDIYPVMMRGNEVALDPTQTKLLDRLVTRLERGGTAGGGTVVVNYSEKTIAPTNSADTKRKARELDRLIKQSRPKYAFSE